MENFGTFISFEGIDGSGKTTQVELLAKRLGINAVVTREPGGTVVSEAIRDIFLSDNDIALTAKLLLITAARIQHIDKVILPALKEGKTVICDRFVDSTIAYQGYRNGISVNYINQLNSITIGNFRPDLTFLLDLSPEIAKKRQLESDIQMDRVDKEPIELHNRVLEGYRIIAKNNPVRVKLIDANRSIEDIHKDIVSKWTRYSIKKNERAEGVFSM